MNFTKRYKRVIAFLLLVSLILIINIQNIFAYINNEEKNTLSNEISLEMVPNNLKTTIDMGSINKDTVYSRQLSAGNVHTYKFTAPTTRMYTVETFGETDTYGTITGSTSPGGTVNDDDSGTNKNFAIGFSLQKGQTVTIKVRHYFASTGSGNYTIQVRDQRAQIYTFEYDDLDTTPDATQPVTSLAPYFSVGNHKNRLASHARQTIAQTFTRINSEIFFFSGHGYFNNDEVRSEVHFSNNSVLTSHVLPTMANTKIAVWAACNSARSVMRTVMGDEIEILPSIAKQAAIRGAACSIGWENVTHKIASRKWTNKFFSEVSLGKTVYEAANSASSVFIWPWEGTAKGWVIFGEENTTINPKVNPKISNANSISKEELETIIKNGNFAVYDLKGEGKRYYKTVNGILTNEYYDILFDSNEVLKSDNVITDKDVEFLNTKRTLSTSYITPKKIQLGSDYLYELEKQEEYLVYMKIEGELIPIKIIYADYRNERNITHQKVTCINMLNNTLMNYEDVCINE